MSQNSRYPQYVPFYANGEQFILADGRAFYVKAYGVRYVLTFVSDRGDDYKIEVQEFGFKGKTAYKKLGAAPVLAIEDGDGRIKGSSLSFSIQADTEGELLDLYTTNNKKFMVVLYKNANVYWQGYLLPELYSESYVDPPYDVAVTATDQLATLKDIVYQKEDEQVPLLSIMQDILSMTLVNLPCAVHIPIKSTNGGLFESAYISAAAFNGYSCYDALNMLLLSCNACVMQIGNEWLITSLTDNSTSYSIDGTNQVREHCTIGQMYKADVWPEGSLIMTNVPALKGVNLEYNHILRNSFLKNANCENTYYWYRDENTINTQFPADIVADDGIVYKCHFWSLAKCDITQYGSYQLWQDVDLSGDVDYTYKLSFKYMMTYGSDTILLAIVHMGDDGVIRRLTANGWESGLSDKDPNSYINVTGEDKTYIFLRDLSNLENYEEATVTFYLPETPGTLRIGFVNHGVKDIIDLARVYITNVYLTLDGVVGKQSTTVVEEDATTAQENIAIAIGDKLNSSNAGKIVLSTLNSSSGVPINTWLLSGREYSSYFSLMLQDLSRYYGSKKMQLQGTVMGSDLLHPYYKDTFSGKILRLVSAQYNLLDDTMGIAVEEVPVEFVTEGNVTYTAQQSRRSVANTTTVANQADNIAQLQDEINQLKLLVKQQSEVINTLNTSLTEVNEQMTTLQNRVANTELRE